jgi:arginine/lysine/ornithine decarboxylase
MTPEFWQAVLVESITGAAAVAVAVATVGIPAWRRLGRIKADAAATRAVATQARDQVKNDHGTNLRDDLDGVHASVRELHRYASQNREAAAAAARDAAAAVQASGSVAVELRRLGEVVDRIERRGLAPRRGWHRR